MIELDFLIKIFTNEFVKIKVQKAINVDTKSKFGINACIKMVVSHNCIFE